MTKPFKFSGFTEFLNCMSGILEQLDVLFSGVFHTIFTGGFAPEKWKPGKSQAMESGRVKTIRVFQK